MIKSSGKQADNTHGGNSHSAIRNLDSSRLQGDQPPRNLVVSGFTNISDDPGVEDRST